jgi:hypothetical protein
MRDSSTAASLFRLAFGGPEEDACQDQRQLQLGQNLPDVGVHVCCKSHTQQKE